VLVISEVSMDSRFMYLWMLIFKTVGVGGSLYVSTQKVTSVE